MAADSSPRAAVAAPVGATVAAVSNAIPDEHKQAINDKVVAPATEAVKSVMPEATPVAKTDSSGSANPSLPASALAYVASGLGAAIKTVTGVDPVNVDKIPVQTPATEVPPIVTSGTPVATESASAEKPVALAAEPTPAAPAAVMDPAISTHTPVVAVAGDTPKDAGLPAAPVEAPPAISPEPTAAAPPTTPTKEATKETTNGPDSKPVVSEAKTPSTPAKTKFPTNGSSSAASTPSKTESARKKRTSIFGKIKHAFHHDKDKEAK